MRFPLSRIGSRAVGLCLVGLIAIAATGPRALSPASGGLWQVTQSARGGAERNVCIRSPIALGQWEHRGGQCTRTILADEGNKTVITYDCAGGGFGRSEITLVTPRTLRVATQGISAGGPFNYVIHARRVGNCRPR